MTLLCIHRVPERPLFLRDEKKCFALWVFRLVITRKCQQVLFALTLPLQLANALFFSDEVNWEKTEDFFWQKFENCIDMLHVIFFFGLGHPKKGHSPWLVHFEYKEL